MEKEYSQTEYGENLICIAVYTAIAKRFIKEKKLLSSHEYNKTVFGLFLKSELMDGKK